MGYSAQDSENRAGPVSSAEADDNGAENEGVAREDDVEAMSNSDGAEGPSDANPHALSTELNQAKCRAGRAPEKNSAGAARCASKRTQAAKEAMAIMTSLKSAPVQRRREAEVEALGKLTAAFSSPTVTASLRELVQKKRRSIAACDPRKLAAVQ